MGPHLVSALAIPLLASLVTSLLFHRGWWRKFFTLPAGRNLRGRVSTLHGGLGGVDLHRGAAAAIFPRPQRRSGRGAAGYRVLKGACASMLSFRRAPLATVLLLAAACSYGPERTFLDLHTFVAKPHSHQFAASLEYARIKDPTGSFNTFPNGGVGKVMSREARIYLGDLDRGTVDLVVAIPDFGGIPQPKSVRVEGWNADVLYFSLFGYGGNDRDGDDLSDERRFFYRATADGRVQEVDALPPRLERGDNVGPVESPPFLRWSRGHLDVDIAIDARLSDAVEVARLTFDPETGEPLLSLP